MIIFVVCYTHVASICCKHVVCMLHAAIFIVKLLDKLTVISYYLTCFSRDIFTVIQLTFCFAIGEQNG